jgi:hypothetical protein
LGRTSVAFPAVGLLPDVVTPLSVLAVDPAVGPFTSTVCAKAKEPPMATKNPQTSQKNSPCFVMLYMGTSFDRDNNDLEQFKEQSFP